jgi:hypothetical protein
MREVGEGRRGRGQGKGRGRGRIDRVSGLGFRVY